jgi:hypothetical protein
MKGQDVWDKGKGNTNFKGSDRCAARRRGAPAGGGGAALALGAACAPGARLRRLRRGGRARVTHARAAAAQLRQPDGREPRQGPERR